jgi:predicted PurR-regulated permease PerM
MPVGVRSLSLAVLAVLAALAALKWASAVLIPLTLGVMLSYAVTPAVNWLERRRVPRHAGAAVVLIALVISGAGTVYSLADDAARVIDSLPLAAQKLRDAVRNQRGQPSALDQVQKAATRIEEAAAPPLATRGRDARDGGKAAL